MRETRCWPRARYEWAQKTFSQLTHYDPHTIAHWWLRVFFNFRHRQQIGRYDTSGTNQTDHLNAVKNRNRRQSATSSYRKHVSKKMYFQILSKFSITIVRHTTYLSSKHFRPYNMLYHIVTLCALGFFSFLPFVLEHYFLIPWHSSKTFLLT